MLDPQRAVIVEDRDAIGSATKSGVPSLVTLSTKATMAAFGPVSFHDGSGSEPLAAVAGAARAASTEMAESFNRRRREMLVIVCSLVAG